MTTRRTIYRLELATPANESDLHGDLVRLLGIVDGTLFPARFAGDQSRYGSEILSQRDYFRDGIQYTVDATDATQQVAWKRSERVRSAMESAGWITLEPNAKVRLTMAGDILARSLVCQSSLNDLLSRACFELLRRAEPERCGGWVSESTLFGIDSTNTDDYQEVSEAMLPLIAFGIVESASTTTARLHYRKLVDELPDKVDCATGEYSEELSTIYTDAFCMSLKQRSNRDGGSEIVIPLGAS